MQTLEDFNDFVVSAPFCMVKNCKTSRDVIVIEGVCYYLPFCYKCWSMLEDDESLRSHALGKKIPCDIRKNRSGSRSSTDLSPKKSRKLEMDEGLFPNKKRKTN